MGIIDSKGKLFGKVNIADVVIILVLLLVIGGVGYKFVFSKKVSSIVNTQDIEISFFAEEINDFVADAINIGDTVKDPKLNANFGKVVDKKVDKSISYSSNSDGKIVESTKPRYVSIIVTAKCKGVKTDTGVMIDNSEYAVGKSMELRVGNAALWCRVHSIK